MDRRGTGAQSSMWSRLLRSFKRRQPAWALVPISIAVAASLLLAARVQAPTPTETPVPSASPAAPGVLDRPYLPESAWNTPIPDSADVDARSDALVGSIGESGNDGVITSDPTQFTYPVYEVGADTPRHDVPCKWFKCTVVGDDGNSERVEVLEDVPIPDWARPSEGSDSSMIIIDVESGTEWDLWKVERQGDGTWSVANGSVYNVGWDGMPEEYGSRGAGLPYLAGLVRHREIVAGEIEHAIAFAYPNVATDICVWPASKTDGQSDAPNALPEGARLQLDPELTEEELRLMGLDQTGLIIARGLQRYGMIVVDVSRRPKIMVEDLTANERAEGSWSDDSETPLHEDTIAAIPFTSFRVLALPSTDSPQAEEQLHGNCYR